MTEDIDAKAPSRHAPLQGETLSDEAIRQLEARLNKLQKRVAGIELCLALAVVLGAVWLMHSVQ